MRENGLEAYCDKFPVATAGGSSKLLLLGDLRAIERCRERIKLTTPAQPEMRTVPRLRAILLGPQRAKELPVVPCQDLGAHPLQLVRGAAGKQILRNELDYLF